MARIPADAGSLLGSVPVRSASRQLRPSQHPAGPPFPGAVIQPGVTRPSHVAMAMPGVSGAMPPAGVAGGVPSAGLRPSQGGLLREGGNTANLRIQRCGIGSSCDCPPRDKLAGIEDDLQHATAVGGTPLPATSRERMENAFSSDFAAVRVHTGTAAHDAASALAARALTAGTDILFRAGEYQPGTPGGDRLLAHELAHVVQQAHGLPQGILDTGATDHWEKAARLAADHAGPAAEREAHGAAMIAALGEPVSALSDDEASQTDAERSAAGVLVGQRAGPLRPLQAPVVQRAEMCDPSVSSCPAGTVDPDGKPNPGTDAPAGTAETGTQSASSPPAVSVDPNAGEPNQSTPAVCDPSVSSCPAGTVDPNGKPNPGSDTTTLEGPRPGSGPGGDCVANFDATTASSFEKLSTALLCSKDTIGNQIYENIVGSLATMVEMAIGFTVLQFVPGVDILVDGVSVYELIKAAVEAGLNYDMAVAIADELEEFLSAINATSNDQVKADGAALAKAVGQSTAFVLMMLVGGTEGEKPTAAEGEAPLADGEYPAVTKGKLTKVVIGESPSTGEGEGPASTPDESAPTTSDATMSDGQPVAAEATTTDGAHEVKVGEDGECEVCTKCLDVRKKYAEALKDPDLEAKLEAAEENKDFKQRAEAIANLVPELESESGRPGSELSDLSGEHAQDSPQDVALTDVDPSEVNVLDLPDYQEGIARASDAFARLTNIESGQNIAGTPGGDQSTSGWSGEKAATTEQAQVKGGEAGHETKPDYRDPQGSEGLYESSHSERQQAASSDSQEFASSKPLCPDCQGWFGSWAVSHGLPYFVADPTGVHVFMPNGSHTVVPHGFGATP